MATHQNDNVPALSLALLAGMVARPLPLFVPNMALRKVIDTLCQHHPAMLERLHPIAGTTFLIVILDLPFNIKLCIQSNKVYAQLIRDKVIPSDVTIKGELQPLFEMLSSQVDGDSLFFSRKLHIEGDTSALLTLRNALDADDINILEEIVGGLGPFQYPVSLFLLALKKIGQTLNDNINLLSQSLMTPANQRMDVLKADTNKMQSKIEELNHIISQQEKKINHLSKKITKSTQST